MIFILIEIGDLLHDIILYCATLFTCGYVLGKLLQLIAAFIMNDTDDYL